MSAREAMRDTQDGAKRLDEGGALATKTCPRCGQVLFSDMDVCYGCLYEFGREEDRSYLLPDPLELVPLDEPALVARDAESEDDSQDDVEVLPSRAGKVPRTAGLGEGMRGLFVQTSDVDLTLPLLADGVTFGRLPTSDVVLHSRAVSQAHARFVPSPEGATVIDLGATNPLYLAGKEVEESAELVVGDTVDLCGTLVTLVEAPR